MSTSASSTPLREMDPNARKRKADEHADAEAGELKDLVKMEIDSSAVDELMHHPREQSPNTVFRPVTSDTSGSIEATPTKRARTGSSSSLSSVGSLLDADNNSTNSPSPTNTPQDDTRDGKNSTPQKTGSQPAKGAPASDVKAKRKRRTQAEMKAHEAELEEKRKEKELKKKEAEDKKAAEAAEKAQKKKEREEKKAIADADKQARDQEREAKRQKKEEEERKAREEKEKKERSQLKLNSFFKVPAVSPKKKTMPPEETKVSSTPMKVDDQDPPDQEPPKPSAYDKMFKPFFVKSGCHLAISPFHMDEETKEAKSRILDEYLSGHRRELDAKKFNPVEVLSLPALPRSRGMIHEPVKATVERFRAQMQKAESSGSIETQERIQRDTRKRLARVPLKCIRFQQDVRPPYFGTTTLVPHTVGVSRMRKVARNPTHPILPLQYDYDSEAEWQDDDGEDLEGDDDDEEDLDDGDEVAGLIDDSDAVDLMRFGSTGLEPLSTGVCWENRQRLGPSAEMYKHRLEVINPSESKTPQAVMGVKLTRKALDHHHSIDPFSTSYWDPEPAAKPSKPKPSATNAFEQIVNTASAPGAEADKTKTKKAGAHADLPPGLSDVDLAIIKKTIVSTYEATPRISKLGMLELLKSSALDGVKVNGKDISRNDVKTVIDVVSLRKMKGGEVFWSIKPEHAL